MIALLAAAAIAAPKIVFVREPDHPFVAFQAAIRLPELSPREEGAVQAVVSNLFVGTEEYSKAQIVLWGSQTFEDPSVELMPGYIRLSMSFPKTQFSTGLSMFESVLCRASLPEYALEEWIAQPKVQLDDYWGIALWPTRAKPRDLRMADVPAAYRRYFRPENVTIAVGGTLTAANEQAVKDRFSTWEPNRERPALSDHTRREVLLKNDSFASTAEWATPEFSLKDADAPTRLLAAFALGVAKDSTLFNVVRQKLRFSYRQEAILWSTPKGFRIRLIAARREAPIPAERLAEVKAAMIADIESWDAETLARAQSMLEASWVHRVGPNPLYLSTTGPLSDSLSDMTFLNAFWVMKTGDAWNPESIVAKANAVKVDELKSVAKSMIEVSMTQTILGMRSTAP